MPLCQLTFCEKAFRGAFKFWIRDWPKWLRNLLWGQLVVFHSFPKRPFESIDERWVITLIWHAINRDAHLLLLERHSFLFVQTFWFPHCPHKLVFKENFGHKFVSVVKELHPVREITWLHELWCLNLTGAQHIWVGTLDLRRQEVSRVGARPSGCPSGNEGIAHIFTNFCKLLFGDYQVFWVFNEFYRNLILRVYTTALDLDGLIPLHLALAKVLVFVWFGLITHIAKCLGVFD